MALVSNGISGCKNIYLYILYAQNRIHLFDLIHTIALKYLFICVMFVYNKFLTT